MAVLPRRDAVAVDDAWKPDLAVGAVMGWLACEPCRVVQRPGSGAASPKARTSPGTCC